MGVRTTANFVRISLVLAFSYYVYDRVRMYMAYGITWTGMSGGHMNMLAWVPLLSMFMLYNSVAILAKIDEDNFSFYAMMQNKNEKIMSAFRLIKLGAFIWIIPLFRIYFIYVGMLFRGYYVDYIEILMYLSYETLNNMLPIMLFYIAFKLLGKESRVAFHSFIFIFFLISAYVVKILFYVMWQPIYIWRYIGYGSELLLILSFITLIVNFLLIIREYGINDY